MAAYTRRHFANLLQTVAAMAVAGLRPACLDAVIPLPEGGPGVASRHFEPLIGSEFRVSTAGGRFSLTLIAVEDMPRRRAGVVASARTVDCALLRFSSGDSALAEGIHRLVHERNGDYDLYLSPGKPGRYLAYLCR